MPGSLGGGSPLHLARPPSRRVGGRCPLPEAQVLEELRRFLRRCDERRELPPAPALVAPQDVHREGPRQELGPRQEPRSLGVRRGTRRSTQALAPAPRQSAPPGAVGPAPDR